MNTWKENFFKVLAPSAPLFPRAGTSIQSDFRNTKTLKLGITLQNLKI